MARVSVADGELVQKSKPASLQRREAAEASNLLEHDEGNDGLRREPHVLSGPPFEQRGGPLGAD